MKIKDLTPAQQKLAITNQIAQGNEPNLELELEMGKQQGNFDWAFSNEGGNYWLDLYNKGFKGTPEKFNGVEPNLKDQLTPAVKSTFKTWKAFAEAIGEDSNLHRKMDRNIDKLNRWLEPIGLKIKLVKL